MTDKKTAMPAPATKPEPKKAEMAALFGWESGGKKSPRLFSERWLAQKAAKNRAKRHGDSPTVVEVRLSDEMHAEKLAEAQAYGTTKRPTEAMA